MGTISLASGLKQRMGELFMRRKQQTPDRLRMDSPNGLMKSSIKQVNYKRLAGIMAFSAAVTVIWNSTGGNHGVASPSQSSGEISGSRNSRSEIDHLHGSIDSTAPRRAQTQSVRVKLNPEEARAAIDLARSQTIDLSLRAIKTSNILHCLAVDGYINEAWEMIDPSYGIAREKEISRILDVTEVPLEQRIQLLTKLSDARDKASACRGLIDSLTTSDLVEFNLSGFEIKDEGLKSQLFAALGEEYIQDMKFLLETKPADYEENVAEMVKSAAHRTVTGQIGINQFRELLEMDSTGTPFTRWEQISAMESDKQIPELDELRRSVIDGMITTDAGATMSELAIYATTHPNSSAISDGVMSWYRQDSKGANDWVVSHGSTLPPKQKDDMIVAVARISFGEGDLQTAQSWANRISDSVIREKILESFQPKPSAKP